MWEDPSGLWQRLKLGREEYLQRLITTLIAGGDPPRWNTPIEPTEAGLRFLRQLHALAHGADDGLGPPGDTAQFVDECLLPKLVEDQPNGWPDWVVLWPQRVWIIELKTEKGSHRANQLPYYLELAAAAHPDADIDLTYLTGPQAPVGPTLSARQRFGHITWNEALPLIEQESWSEADGAAPYVAMVREVVTNLGDRSPQQQREAVIGTSPAETVALLALARRTSADGEQRAVGAQTATHLEELRDTAREQISALPDDDPVRHVLPWLWKASSTDGSAMTVEGAEFGYELRFSRYRSRQISS